MKNTIVNIATFSVMTGCAVFGGSLLFTAGALTITGWVVATTFFVGGATHATMYLVSLLPEKKDSKEIDGKKPGTQPAASNS